jgi:hypothetical protein
LSVSLFDGVTPDPATPAGAAVMTASGLCILHRALLRFRRPTV